MCEHDFVKSPFYVHVAVTYKEPDYYPPQGLLSVEMCSKCGTLKIPSDYLKYKGMNNLHDMEVRDYVETIGTDKT